MAELTKAEVKDWIQEATAQVQKEKSALENNEHAHETFKADCPSCGAKLGICKGCEDIKEIEEEGEDDWE